MTWTYTDIVDVLDSSSIDVMWYNEHTKELAVEYMSGMHVYGWKNVPLNVWQELKRQATIPAGSVGQYHAANVKGQYDSFTPEESDYYDTVFDKFQRVLSPAAAISEDYTYIVRGTRPFEATIMASSMNEALEKVKSQDENIRVTQVTVTFDA